VPQDIRCPECGSETVLRTSKKGPNAGRTFHVCIHYPECKGKVPIGEYMGTAIPSGGGKMFCSNCGVQLPDNSRFCSECGVEIGTMLPPTPLAPAPPKALAKPKVELKWGPILVSAIIGLALLEILSYTFITDEMIEEMELFNLLLVSWGIAIPCYIICGAIAGTWAGFRGAAHGMRAAMIMAIISALINIILTFTLWEEY
jgi:hypothetical protein